MAAMSGWSRLRTTSTSRSRENVPTVTNGSDLEAKEHVAYASTLAGMTMQLTSTIFFPFAGRLVIRCSQCCNYILHLANKTAVHWKKQ